MRLHIFPAVVVDVVNAVLVDDVVVIVVVVVCDVVVLVDHVVVIVVVVVCDVVVLVVVIVVVCDVVVLVANLETIETKMKISLLHRRRVSLFLFRFEISNKRIEKCSITISGDFSQMVEK